LFKQQNIKSLTDEELVKAFCKEENNSYLEVLYSRYIRFVFLVCLKYLKNQEKAKDTAMQVFEKLTGDLKRFEVRNFKSWLHVITKNTCLMEIRYEKGIEIIPIDEKKELQNNVENSMALHPDSNEGSDLKFEQLQRAMENLDNEQKQCIELFFLQEKSYKEVAEVTGFSMNQVKSYIQNGKRNLKNILINNGELTLYLIACLLFNK
jgi:RNA polymerase sigma factor (sigma-70 family)